MTLHSSPHLDETRNESPVLSISIPVRTIGIVIMLLCALALMALASWSVDDPSFSYATDKPAENWLGFAGAAYADFTFQFLGLSALILLVTPLAWAYSMARRIVPSYLGLRVTGWLLATILASGFFACFPTPESWPLPLGLGGYVGNMFAGLANALQSSPLGGLWVLVYALILGVPAFFLMVLSSKPRAVLENETPLPTSKRIQVHNPRISTTGIDDRAPSNGSSAKLGIFGAAKNGLGNMFKRTAPQPTGHYGQWRAQDAQQTQPNVEPQMGNTMRSPDVRSDHAAKSRGYSEPNHAQNYNEDDFDHQDQQNQYAAYDEDTSDDYVDFAPEPTQQPSQYQRRAQQQAAPQAPLARNRQEPPLTRNHAVNDSMARAMIEEGSSRVSAPAPRPQPSQRPVREAQSSFLPSDGFELPPLDILAMPPTGQMVMEHQPEALEANAKRLEGVLEDFGVKGDIINVRPGPVVTLYELEPAPGIKSSRVISLADDIARSMSAISARVAVVPGRNAIGVELPNKTRETVYFRELLDSKDYEKAKAKLPICMGKTIGGEPIIVDLARMPHLLIAGTTGSGKSVGINTMILSLLYKMTPEQCRMIMIDPKMLELSIYDGIPHLLTPVVTDPTKAVVALKWAVREMEDRYKKMSKIGVRNIDGFNQRVSEAAASGEVLTRTVQTGFDRETGEAIFESETFDLKPIPFIVIVVDEMADLMMVAGKDIEGAIQRLAQMARAAGIHLIMATQRPSVDVITGTIKANFPTRVSFQVTSKIDSRTILGEQGAEQLLGNGDMLYMAGGGRTQRLHGAFVADAEVEAIVNHLKSQGTPEYLETITREEDEAESGGGGIGSDGDFGGSGDELYDRAVNIVLNDKKASTSYIQRRLSIGYNKAATLIERMEQEGIISPANHAGKREVLIGDNAEGY